MAGQAVKLEKIDEGRLRKFALDAKIKNTVDADKKQLVVIVEKWLHKEYNVELLRCSNCEFGSPAVDQITKCPGCGERFDENVGEDDEPPVIDSVASLHPAFSPEQIEQRRQLLYEKLKQIRGHQINWTLQVWQIGRIIHEIYDQDLWRYGPWKNFNEFTEQELKYSHQTARDFMEIAVNFTREQLEGVTVTNARLVLKAPEDRREEVLKYARDEQPKKREMEERVLQEREKAGEVIKHRKPPALPPPAAPPPSPPTSAGVLVTARLKPGPVATFKSTKVNDVWCGRFKLGEYEFTMKMNKKGETTIALKTPRAADA